MILVTVGTNEARFDRLLRAFESMPSDEELLVQHGPSPVRPAGAVCVPYLPYDELVEAIRRARVVVMHAGVGSIMTALANGKRPVACPRLRRFGEAVDDHQVPFGMRLHQAGLVTFVEHPDALRDALETAGEGTGPVHLEPDRRLVAELREYVRARTLRPR